MNFIKKNYGFKTLLTTFGPIWNQNKKKLLLIFFLSTILITSLDDQGPGTRVLVMYLKLKCIMATKMGNEGFLPTMYFYL